MDIKEIEHLAELSKLEFTNQELEDFKKDFENIIALADLIKNANVHADRKINVVDMKQLREDVAKKSEPVDLILQNAPSKTKDSFVVPRIVE